MDTNEEPGWLTRNMSLIGADWIHYDGYVVKAWRVAQQCADIDMTKIDTNLTCSESILQEHFFGQTFC